VFYFKSSYIGIHLHSIYLSIYLHIYVTSNNMYIDTYKMDAVLVCLVRLYARRHHVGQFAYNLHVQHVTVRCVDARRYVDMRCQDIKR